MPKTPPPNRRRQLPACDVSRLLHEDSPLRHFILVLSLLLVHPWTLASIDAVAADADRLDGIFPKSTLTIATPDARVHRFNVWVAGDDRHRQLGLMFVKDLGEDAGMLFIYPQSQPISMWMKNTVLSLDMLFVAADGRIANVVESTTPQSEKIIESKGPVLGVIELKAGTAKRLHIQAGARVEHPAFKSQ
jgi:uncharacterized membrane protein (UPF0127 family)